VRLERNYRSTQSILDAASSVVANNVDRKGKNLYTERAGGEPVRFYEAADERGEASYVIGELLRLHETGSPLGDAAVFYRTHSQSRPLEEELLKYNLPYVIVGGTRFYDRAEVKDALAYLRVVNNPDDAESLLRIINKPARGIGRTTVGRLLEIAEKDDSSLFSGLLRARAEKLLRGAAATRVPKFVTLIEDLRSHDASVSITELLARVLDRSGYLRALEAEGTVESEARIENLKELLAATEEFERQNLEDRDADAVGERALLDLFLEQVTLLTEADTLEAAADRVALMTVHVAKGLEFPNVFMVGMEEGLFPHFASLDDPAAIEEERRICYVGMTRAEQRLYLVNASMRRMHGATRHNTPSRFLEEIPADLGVGRAPRELLQRGRHLPAPAAGLPRRDTPPPPEPGPRVDYSEGQWDADELPPLHEGTRVEHPVFGAGTIQQVSGAGKSTKIRIRFDRAGLKTIMLRYAQLRLLG
jgi:DNA helicase-2/ATP-dependent DNA helicase PcrA